MGIAVGAGMRNIEVPGANGGLNTNYEGKAEAGVKALLRRALILSIFMWKLRMRWDTRAVWREK